MGKQFIFVVICALIAENIILSCLITNCPRGGKRSGRHLLETNIKPCVSCGPGLSGQCFGDNICCGPFGCLIATPETIKCQKEGFFREREPCIAGTGSCRKNTGRCAAEGICCNQESCHTDRSCTTDDKPKEMSSLDLYSLINYSNSFEYGEK